MFFSLDFKCFAFSQGAVQGPEEFAEGFVIGVRSLFGHTVGRKPGTCWLLLHFTSFSVYESVKATGPDVDGSGLNPRTDVSSNQRGPLSKGP